MSAHGVKADKGNGVGGDILQQLKDRGWGKRSSAHFHHNESKIRQQLPIQIRRKPDGFINTVADR
jgi:hypothetical protein